MQPKLFLLVGQDGKCYLLPMHTDIPDSPSLPAHQRLMQYATYASVSVACLLILAKGAAWWVSDSLSMLSALTDSFFDSITSVINLLAVRYAMKPADDDHRFGHTGIEDIAGLAQFLFIGGSMLVIALQSVERLFDPQPLQHEAWGLTVAAFSVLVTGMLVAFQTYVTRRTGSLIIASDRAHYASDIIFNIGVMLAFGCSMGFGIAWADPAFALLIACVVLWATRSIGIRAFNNLMNREMPQSDRTRIIAALEAVPGIRSHAGLKTRFLGTKAVVQVEIGIDRHMDFEEAHRITHEAERALTALFASADVIVHANPE